MNIQKQFIQNQKNSTGEQIPSIVMTPENPTGAAIIIHGYGGSKEEQLGLAWRIAESGITSITIDLRGHGENTTALDEGITSDIEAALSYGRSFGKVTAIGHSLGGRLALLSEADFAIAISPALRQQFSETTQNILKNLRNYRVKEGFPDANFTILKNLPLWQPGSKKALILYGTRDVPEIMEDCRKFKPENVKVKEIYQALHNDIYLHETTFTYVIDQFKEWYSLP